VKNLGGIKREILRGVQNDKKSLLIAHWYQNIFISSQIAEAEQLW
jgi:hypothetical protein